ncbi:MAG: response regulator transcription factor [Leadbetterella sp.]|nr:response regulator transcription factor [Leadbetterella sp.]
MKIVIADDHQMFSDAVKDLLAARGYLVTQEKNPGNLVYRLQKERPQLLLLDIRFPDANGLELAGVVKSMFPAVKIIMVTMYNELRMIRLSQQVGADGYVLKDSPPQILFEAIEEILSGGRYYDPKLKQEKYGASGQWELTEKEKLIISRLVKGKKASEIAQELGVGYETVKTHRKNIYLKLNINSLAELMLKVSAADWDPGM